MKIVLISDTHTKHRHLDLPEGDLLIHAGDITYDGTLADIEDFNLWIGEQRPKFNYGVIVIAGNHDLTMDQDHRKYDPQAEKLLSNCIYLNDSGCDIGGLKIWGSPVQPNFGWGWAFNRGRGEGIKEHWDKIPANIDILITHGPPHQVLDYPFGKYPPVGCADLMDAILRIKPKLHVFGHIHGSYGDRVFGDTHFVNASSLDEVYRPVNIPIVVEIEQ